MSFDCNREALRKLLNWRDRSRTKVPDHDQLVQVVDQRLLSSMHRLLRALEILVPRTLSKSRFGLIDGVVRMLLGKAAARKKCVQSAAHLHVLGNLFHGIRRCRLSDSLEARFHSGFEEIAVCIGLGESLPKECITVLECLRSEFAELGPSTLSSAPGQLQL